MNPRGPTTFSGDRPRATWCLLAFFIVGVLAAAVVPLKAAAQPHERLEARPPALHTETPGLRAPALPTRTTGVSKPAADTTEPASDERKSPGRALAYSIGGTVLLTPLFGTGLIVGPGLGHFYAGNAGQAWTGMALRGGAVLSAGLGGVLLVPFVVCPARDRCRSRRLLGEATEPVGTGLFVAGLLGGTASLIYDIVTAPRAAREHNREQGLEVRAAPQVGPSGQVGLSVRILL